MTTSSVHYLCPHTTPISAHPPRFDLSTSSILGIHYHPLSSLLFCEECDAVRCDQCVSCELNCYYCPNCLFEVPAANVRSQKNRCSRNCFICPQCQHTLSAVATDPPTSSFNDDYKALESSVGQPPYFLSCSFCRWDSKLVGITFEKPTFLAQQLSQAESSQSELLEFDKLKEHFEGYLKSQSQLQTSSNPTHSHSNSINQRIQQQPSAGSSPAHLAASLALSKQVLNLTRYGSQLGPSSSALKLRPNHAFLNHHQHHSHLNHIPANANPDGSWREDLPVYQSLFPHDSSKRSKLKNQADRLAYYRHADRSDPKEDQSVQNLLIEQTTPLEKKWDQVWDDLDRVEDLKPNRVPLRSKRTKRCPTCQHILIKPEQKAQSIRFKIKLIASNYLPFIELQRKRLATSSKLGADRLTSGMSAARKSAAASRTASAGSNPLLGRVGEPTEEVIRPDRKYQFEMTFSNPLYEPINVRLMIPPATPVRSPIEGEPDQIPYQINLLASEFTISAFAEVWEYDDEDQSEGAGNEEIHDQKDPDEAATLKSNRLSTFGLADSARRRSLHTNVVTKKANRTTILLEAKTSKQFFGTLHADMLVTFTYRSDDLNDELEDSQAGHNNTSSNLNRRKTDEDAEEEVENQKSFTFWTKLTFGEVGSLVGLQPSASTILDSTNTTATVTKKKVPDVS